MNIFLDNNKIDITLEANDKLKTIIESMERFAVEQGRIISEISIDGKSYYEPDIDIPISQISNIEVYTKTPRLVFLETMQEMNSYFEKFELGIGKIVDLLAQDKSKEAMHLILDAITGLEWIYNAFSSLQSISDIDFEDIGFNNVFERYQQLLEEILDCLEMKDNIMLSDLLEYEMIEVLEEIKEFLPIIYDYVLDEEKNSILKS